MAREISKNIEIKEEMVFSVKEYIEAVNIALSKFKVRITGEVTAIKFGPTGHCYFTIKDNSLENDKDANSVLDCIIWKYDYKICEVDLVEGLEVVLSGEGRIYQGNGRFSFVAKTIELKGEGALKRAYEKLKAKLEQEGLFDPANKKPLPDFPQKIGVITSKQGAVIHDLLNNLGKFGFQIKMIDSRVEGQEAVADLLSAIKTFAKQEIDVLIIMRGGGSLESLQPFNNENIARAIFNFQCPIISAIGHDKDIPLVALVADYNCSTPTAAANIINKSWEMAHLKIDRQERIIFEGFNIRIFKINNFLLKEFNNTSGQLAEILQKGKEFKKQVFLHLLKLRNNINEKRKKAENQGKNILSEFKNKMQSVIKEIYFLAKNIEINNPEKNLALGYCIAFKNKKVVRKTTDFEEGEDFDLRVIDGIVESTAKKIVKSN